jgi:hypothetical protein
MHGRLFRVNATEFARRRFLHLAAGAAALPAASRIARAQAYPTRLKAQLAHLGGMVLGGSPADFEGLVAEETEKWAKVIKLSGVKLD